MKRIVAVPGDRVAMQDNELTINGEPARYEELGEAELRSVPTEHQRRFHFYREHVLGHTRIVMHHRSLGPTLSDDIAEVVVPPDHYLMLGDNRDDSADSRAIGLVSRDRIIGRAHTVAFSFDYDAYYMPRIDRFIHSLDYD